MLIAVANAFGTVAHTEITWKRPFQVNWKGERGSLKFLVQLLAMGKGNVANSRTVIIILDLSQL